MLICGIKNLRDVKIGDTVVHASQAQTPNLPGYKEVADGLLWNFSG